MTTLYFRGNGHLGPGEATDPATVNFIPGDFLNSCPVGYATVTDDDPCRDQKLQMIAKYGPGLGIVAVDFIPPKAPTVIVHEPPTPHVYTIREGWDL
jgi:hypothetical protein